MTLNLHASVFVDQSSDNGLFHRGSVAGIQDGILFFPQELVGELLARESLLSRNYIRYLSGRIRFLTEKLDGLLAGSAERKLSQYLLSHPDGVSCPATSLARQLGVSRASLYRAFDALTERGAICRAGKRIEVLDEHLLYSV